LVGYLLDTNHVGLLARKEAGIVARLQSQPPDTQVRICAITLGEITASRETTTTTNQQKRDEEDAFIKANLLPNLLPISNSTGIYYGLIIGRLGRSHPSPSQHTRTEYHLVAHLGVDINDVWVVASAWEHGLTLLTTDKMECIRDVVNATEVRFDSWI
jgi:predicted nucleic acid-binding protein